MLTWTVLSGHALLAIVTNYIAERPRTTRLAFGTALRRRPTYGTANACRISFFFAVVRVFSTLFAFHSTSDIGEFTGAAWYARSLSLIVLTETNGATDARG